MSKKDLTKKFNLEIESLINRIDASIKDFKFNVSIALFYETYKIFNFHMNLAVDNKSLKTNYIKIMKLMIPFVPHIANECLDFLKCKDRDQWPEISKDLRNEIKFAIQINGKTRDIITIKKDLEQDIITKSITKNSKINKFIENKKIIKTIFVKNRIINYIIK